MNRRLKAIPIFATRVFGIIHATLREIFDEASYSRFLGRGGMASSAESYAAFRREIDETKARRPKCC
jgi:hypothetical protein